MKKILFACFVSLGSYAVAQTHSLEWWDTYRDSVCTIQYPQGWTYLAPAEGEQMSFKIVSQQENSKDLCIENFSLTITNTNPSSNVSKTVEDILSNLAVLPKMKVINRTQDSNPAGNYDIAEFTCVASGLKLYFVQCLWYNIAGKNYLLMLCGSDKEKKKWKPVFLAIARSFALN
jgi:hypothetical protein